MCIVTSPFTIPIVTTGLKLLGFFFHTDSFANRIQGAEATCCCSHGATSQKWCLCVVPLLSRRDNQEVPSESLFQTSQFHV